MQDNYFYVVYDIYDNLKFICNNKLEFSNLTGVLTEHVNTRFKKSFNKGLNYISVIIDDRFYKCYRYLKDEI